MCLFWNNPVRAQTDYVEIWLYQSQPALGLGLMMKLLKKKKEKKTQAAVNSSREDGR